MHLSSVASASPGTSYLTSCLAKLAIYPDQEGDWLGRPLGMRLRFYALCSRKGIRHEQCLTCWIQQREREVSWKAGKRMGLIEESNGLGGLTGALR
ncbi:hypothetical protein Y1Q_0014755 [Alligator mississippiensis]|uniref:Uncharacterized protein n=1 Tax=Alligator mississippiensis TaxID=8496 RepID=A0A151M1T5_ALLMI|nr:hypothetical protein Y1Q_0014755 [Alligator mississippiensis]